VFGVLTKPGKLEPNSRICINLKPIMKFDLLERRYQKSFWGSVWITLGFAVVIQLFIASGNDWLRLICFAVASAIAQSLSKRAPLFGFNLFFASNFAIFVSMALDQSSVLYRLNLGVLGFSALITPVVMAYGVFVGRTAAILGALVGFALLIPLMGFPQWPVATFQISLGAMVGGLLHDLFVRLEHSQQQLERAALRDDLTNLENRRSLRIAFDRYQGLTSRQNVPLLITAWDVNDLKQINDRQGHAAGDAYLLEFVRALTLEARKEDIFFRVGGDEFVGLHPGLEFGEEFSGRVQARFPAVSVGWSLALEDLDRTLSFADQMMYANKASMKSTGPASDAISV
jgi:GGDEF domain-containing protein